MNKYLVVDKQEGFSFKCDGPFEVLEAVGCDECTFGCPKCLEKYNSEEYSNVEDVINELYWNIKQ